MSTDKHKRFCDYPIGTFFDANIGPFVFINKKYTAWLKDLKPIKDGGFKNRIGKSRVLGYVPSKFFK